MEICNKLKSDFYIVAELLIKNMFNPCSGAASYTERVNCFFEWLAKRCKTYLTSDPYIWYYLSLVQFMLAGCHVMEVMYCLICCNVYV